MYIQNVRYNYAEPNPDPKSIKAVGKNRDGKKNTETEALRRLNNTTPLLLRDSH